MQNINAVISAIKIIIRVIIIGLLILGRIMNIDVIKHIIDIVIIYNYRNWTYSSDFKGHCALYTILYVILSSSSVYTKVKANSYYIYKMSVSCGCFKSEVVSGREMYYDSSNYTYN